VNSSNVVYKQVQVRGVSGSGIRDTLKPSMGVRQPFPTADGPGYRHPTPPPK